MLLEAPTLRESDDPRRDAARTLESLVLQKVLLASGAFHGSQAAGAGLWGELLAEAVASSVTKQGGLGLAATVEAGLPSTSPVLAGPGTVTSQFGPRADPLDGSARFHDGVDIAAERGTPILSQREGVVIHAGPRGGYGNAVEVRHADGTTALYAHADTVSVQVGAVVHAGEPLATVGSTGKSTGPHLHFELREGGVPIDPQRALRSYQERADEHGDTSSRRVP